MSKAGPLPWMIIKHIMKHLKATFGLQIMPLEEIIFYKKNCNVYRERNTNIQKSTMKYVSFLSVGVNSWDYKKQSTITLFTMKAKQMTISHYTKKCHLTWVNFDKCKICIKKNNIHHM